MSGITSWFRGGAAAENDDQDSSGFVSVETGEIDDEEYEYEIEEIRMDMNSVPPELKKNFPKKIFG